MSSLLPCVYLLQIPLEAVCIGYNDNEDDNPNKNSILKAKGFREVYKVSSLPARAGPIMHE